ncbi:DUF3102 domain-containing protein [Desulfosporosinus shakirovi]|uniref:DUF3102 domain-containing protein n=1 Tax=Desulfosporosinus shakirovi TaxID=2885154 RepID=UPI0028A1436F|nr:DUF3102 domain-containing protein [Desulfosporosinus sp. SRJS8]MCB8815247.1 DUF3102 domain-containing protein [Desulfosporosinus sp. SRJS8]
MLLEIPEEERDEFIAEHDVESMTKLELQQAVKDRVQAILEKKDLLKDLDLKSSEIAQFKQNKMRGKSPLILFCLCLLLLKVV